MNLDNTSFVNGNYHTLTIETPVAHKVPGTQEIIGGDLVPGDGSASIESNGYYDGNTYDVNDKVTLDTTEKEGYYKITASGKGSVERQPVTKQTTEEGFFIEDDYPTEVIASDSIDSNIAQTSCYIKKSSLSTDNIVPDYREQIVRISDGYFPDVRRITVAPITESYPETSLVSINMQGYFYSANKADYDVKIIPQYTNEAGYVIAHTDFNNGGTEYYKVKRTAVSTSATTIDNDLITRGEASWNEGWIASGRIEPATFKNAPVAGKTYIDISNTDEAPILVEGDYLYVNAGYVDNIKISLNKLTGK